jgi:hypothetical protein
MAMDLKGFTSDFGNESDTNQQENTNQNPVIALNIHHVRFCCFPLNLKLNKPRYAIGSTVRVGSRGMTIVKSSCLRLYIDECWFQRVNKMPCAPASYA